ncbi:hypothetical protein INT43_004962 [Umbelopsis isabellina]|uniref:F-box domain-containing protein n=1 Tax=Mortierella isabellina TaxID=91625 RepID=A0A8H7PEX4_MORIS|nr:hypothetical protein INT43_004962 [Umbelopsis isabellina]
MNALPSDIIAHILSMSSESTLRECMLVDRRLHTHAQKCLYTSVEFEVKTFNKFFNTISSKLQESNHSCIQWIEEFSLDVMDLQDSQKIDSDDEYSDYDDDIATVAKIAKARDIASSSEIWNQLLDLRSILESCKNLEGIHCPTNIIEERAQVFGHRLRYLIPKQLMHLLPAPIPLQRPQRPLVLPNKLFDLYTTSTNANHPGK